MAFKNCPKCALQCTFEAHACPRCGHQFSTQFNQPAQPNQTQPFGAQPGWHQPPQGPQGYPPPGYHQPLQGPQGYPPPGYQQPGYPPYGYAPMPGIIQVPPGTHSVTAAVLLAVFIGGWAGALVNRQVAKGLVFWLLGGAIVSCATGGLGLFIIYPLALVDTILIAGKLNRGEPVREWQFF